MSRFLKCIICNLSHQAKKSQNPELFTKVFEVYCKLLKIRLEGSMRWNFIEEGIPFCEFCAASVEKVWDLNNKLESIESAISSILQRTKENILKSANWRRRVGNSANSGDSDSRRIYNFQRQAVIEFDPDVEIFKNSTIFGENTLKSQKRLKNTSRRTSKAKINNLNQNRTSKENRTLFSSNNSQADNTSKTNLSQENLNEHISLSEDDALNMIDNNLESHNSFQIQVHEPSLDDTFIGPALPTDTEPALVAHPKIECLSSEIDLQDIEDVNIYTQEDDRDDSSETRQQLSTADVTELNIGIGKETRTRNSIITSDGRLFYYGVEYKYENGSYTCGKCSATISARHNILRHVRKYCGKPRSRHTGADTKQKSNFTAVKRKSESTKSTANPQEVSFECEVCGVAFNRLTNFHRHKYTVHNIIPNTKPNYICKYCCRRFFIKGSYNKHMQLHSDGNNYACKDKNCNRSFVCLLELQKHNQMPHHVVKKYTCSYCVMVFKYPSQLRTHLLQHALDINETAQQENVITLAIECPEMAVNTGCNDLRTNCIEEITGCNNSSPLMQENTVCNDSSTFIQENTVSNDSSMRIEENTVCEDLSRYIEENSICNDVVDIEENVQLTNPSLTASSQNTGSVMYHRGVEIKIFDGYFQCGCCGYSLQYRHSIQQHIESNHFDPTTSHKCRYCGMPFGRRNVRKEHEKRHNGCKSYNYQCDLCEKHFLNTDTLLYHRNQAHGENNSSFLSFQCRHCENVFPTKKSCQIHERVHIYEPRFKCSKKYCTETCSSLLDIRNHELTCDVK